VLARLQRALPPDQYATWLAPTVLLDHLDDLAVIGAPNVFARDELATTHRAAIERAWEAAVGRPVAVEIVIA
jgi:chromosomal replication initiation ATPase DnaA